jgi:hypothetical protein
MYVREEDKLNRGEARLIDFRTKTVSVGVFGMLHFYLREGGWTQKIILFQPRWFLPKNL